MGIDHEGAMGMEPPSWDRAPKGDGNLCRNGEGGWVVLQLWTAYRDGKPNAVFRRFDFKKYPAPMSAIIYLTYHFGKQLQNARRVITKVARHIQIGASMAGTNSDAVM